MKKIILISAVTLFSAGAYAAGCNESSLKGKFGYEVSGVNEFPLYTGPLSFIKVTRSTHVVGQAIFDGKGKFDIIGYGSAAGATAERTGHGTYEVDPATCIATGSLDWNVVAPAPSETSDFYIVMDNTDNGKSPSRAYHATVMVNTAAPYSASASGTLTRFAGKFN